MMVYKEDPEYMPFDESFSWPDHECSSLRNVNEGGLKEHSMLKDEYLCKLAGSSVDTDNFCKLAQSSDDTDYAQFSNTNPLKNMSKCENVRDNVISFSDTFQKEIRVSNDLDSSNKSLFYTDKNSSISVNNGSNISSNCSNRSLLDINFDGSSNISTSDASTNSPEASSLKVIRKKMSLMYKKKQRQCDFQKILANAHNSKENIKNIKIPKQLGVIEDKLKVNTNFMSENMPNAGDSKCIVNDDKKKLLKNHNLKENIKNIKIPKQLGVMEDKLKVNTNFMSENMPNGVNFKCNFNDDKKKVLANDNVIQTTNNISIEAVRTNTLSQVNLSKHIETITSTNSIPNEESLLVASYNYSLPYMPMFQDNHFLNDMSSNMLPSNYIIYHQYLNTIYVNSPSIIPHMNYMQGFPMFYCPAPIFPMLSSSEKHFK
ncbi:unnamed protein product, partial [Meganyctiphanes norvegica]